MSTVARMFAQYHQQDAARLRAALHDISVHVGGSAGLPGTVVQAAESLRERLNQLRGYPGIPRDAEGQPVPFSVVGR